MQHSLITNKKSWFYSPWVTLILVIFVVWGCVSVVRAYEKQHEAVSMLNQSQSDLDHLTAEQNTLTNEIQSLSTDRGVEAEVRERYRVVKPGEQLVIVVDNGSTGAAPVKETFWQKLRQFIGF